MADLHTLAVKLGRVLGLGTLVTACLSSSWDSSHAPAAPSARPFGIRVVDQHLENAAGETLVLRGVNRSGTEYQCIKPDGNIFDGPFDEASVAVMASAWNVNAVRVPLNESCWLAINGVPEATAGETYKNAIKDYVALLQAHGLTPILDLHWVGPGDRVADRLHPMPDADHAPAFWSDVATTFLDDPDVVLEPFNEPYPIDNADTPYAWDCWRDGCDSHLGTKRGEVATDETYRAAGMGKLLTAIRDTGATHLVLLGGIQYSNNLDEWLEHVPTDPLKNVAAAWHVYDNNPCLGVSCWDEAPAKVLERFPLVVTEFGERSCTGEFVTPLLDWLDARGSGYLAWSWNAFGACRPPSDTVRSYPWSLITDYATGTPTPGYPEAYHAHLERLR